MNQHDRSLVDSVAFIAQDLQKLRRGQSPIQSKIDKLAVQLRVLLLDGGSGHFERAWNLLGLAGLPTVDAPDLESSLLASRLSQDSIIWIEAPLEQSKPEKWEFVVEAAKFVPPDMEGSQMFPLKIGTLVATALVAKDGRSLICGYDRISGSVIATKYQPLLILVNPASNLESETERFFASTSMLAKKITRKYKMSELCASTAIMVGHQKLSRRDAIGFLANRRGAHIDPKVRVNFRDRREVERETQYSALRNIPSWVNKLPAVSSQVLSLGLCIGSSHDVTTFMRAWKTLPEQSPYSYL